PIWLADGTTQVPAILTVTLAQLQRLTLSLHDALPICSNLTWTVLDDGGTANGGVNTLTETLSITVSAVNDAPVRTAGSPAAVSRSEEHMSELQARRDLVCRLLREERSSDESSQTLTYK